MPPDPFHTPRATRTPRVARLSLRAGALAVALASWLARPAPAFAQQPAATSTTTATRPTPPSHEACACTAERREIASLQTAQRSCESAQASCEARADRAASELTTLRHEFDEARGATAACQSAREQICSAAGELVTGVLQMRTDLPGVGPCVSSANQRALGETVSSWRSSRATLQRLEAFARGDTDALPPVSGPGRGEIDALVQRLAGGSRDAPLVYRRLLVEAVRSLAPRFFGELRAAGRDAVDDWFASSTDLDPAFLAEAQAALANRGDGAGAGSAQSAALRFVQSYLDLVGCRARPHLRECSRAAQLEMFLESSTALIVRQRVREIWQSRCADLEAPAILGWLREFPTPQPSLGSAEWAEVSRAAYDKLVSCYLAEPSAAASHFPDWLTRRLPGPAELTRSTLAHLDALRGNWAPGGPEALCLRAAYTLRNLAPPADCSLPEPARASLRAWFERRDELGRDGQTLAARACTAYVDALWRGRDARVLDAFPGVPTVDELVGVARDGATRATQALRAHCAERAGPVATFPRRLREVAQVAATAGEDTSAAPWHLDAGGAGPREAGGLGDALRFGTWVRLAATGGDACAALGLPAARCATCSPALTTSRYHCGLLATVEQRFRWWQRLLAGGLLALLGLAVVLRWGVGLARALRTMGAWRREIVGHLRSIGLAVDPDPWRFVFPSRMPVVRLTLPGGPWERWGRTMAVVRADRTHQITERDVRSAALAARARDGEVAVVTHDEGASPNLAAVRSMLDWAARSPRGAVQILPVSTERLRWARSTDDLLDLVEQVSLRGNPFEVRGRLVSSSQFFNRERLVSGLLANAQAGAWTVVTGLRRFGKSSLALEVARRLQAPYAYVDLAGFHHEVASGADPTRSVDAILRYVCRQLHASAETLYGKRAALPAPPTEGTSLDIDPLSSWVRAFLAACREAHGGRPVSPLVIFDEVEQAIGVGADRVASAIDVLSILVGRLRAGLSDTLATHGGDRVGVLFCSAIHAALWAPLTTLGRQSLLGAFPSVSVPRLPEDAAFAMMRGLGARQGIRFTDQALALIVREAQGIPILVRRIGSSVLELYDPERARQGSLGAVEIGIEGATAAVRREEEDGAPLRVWVESEIGDLHSPVGGLLRLLARQGTLSVDELKQRAAEATEAQFEELGLARVLGPDETRRRAQEAAGFLVRMLDEIGILVPEGDATRPHAFTFPDSIVRRILAAEGSASLLGF